VKEKGFITFTAYWSPVSEFAAEEPLLRNVIRCFARSAALTDAQLAAATEAAANPPGESESNGTTPWGALVSGSDGSFTFQAPASWSSNVSASGESTGLALDAPGSDASVAFLYNLGRYGVVDAATFAQNTMSITYGIQTTLTNQRTVDGADLFDFTGTFGGKAVEGGVAVRIEAYQTFFAHYLGVMIADAGLWENYAATLNAIQSSIRLTDAGQQLNSLPAMPNYDTATVFGEAGSSLTSGSSNRSRWRWLLPRAARWRHGAADAGESINVCASPSASSSSSSSPLSLWCW
jgi:hypothetical protein